MVSKFNILLLNGPNLNLLGTREPDKYGDLTLNALEEHLTDYANHKNTNLHCLQSNAEHVLIDAIHLAKQQSIQFILINPGAYTHTSIALRDALLGVNLPFFEIHISNIFARESFRHHSYLSDIAQGVICGLGTQGYVLALQAAIDTLSRSSFNHVV